MTPVLDRAELLRRFETLLDAALTAEAPPSGLDPEILAAAIEGQPAADTATDFYALWSAMTALTQEVRLEGRAFTELSRTLTGQTERVAEELRAVYREREADIRREAERGARKEALGVLIDLRDRLTRGRESVRARIAAEPAETPRLGLFARLFRKPTPATSDPTLTALIRGYELGLERIDGTLDEYRAREIVCLGQPFDPRRMNALESEESAAPPGTVLAVYLSGYEWQGEVFRPAQVKVSRK